MTVKELKEFLKDIPDNIPVRLVRDISETPSFTYEEKIRKDGIKTKRVVIS